MSKQTVVFVPGIMGSVLALGGQVIWPGSPKDFIFGYKKLRELMSDDLVATDIIRSVSISTQYQALMKTLEKCGFHESDGTLVPLPYDWRRSNFKAAEALADRLDRIRDDTEVILIGHSMGGLVCRHYLESRRFDHRAAFAKVRALITLGTPHRGSPMALPAILGYDRKVFLTGPQVKEVASDDRFPAVYELLPPEWEPCFWNADVSSRYTPLQLGSLAAALGLSLSNLASSMAFHQSMDLARRPADVRYFFFSGTRMETTTGVRIDVRNPANLDRIDVKDGGDGTVPTWSSLANGVQGAFVGGEHGEIYKNQDLRQVLAVLLGYTGTLAVVEEVEVAVKDTVVEPAQRMVVLLSVSAGVSSVEGHLQTIRVDAGIETPAGPPLAVTVGGAVAEHIQISMDAPDTPGEYRLRFVAMDGRALGEDEFFVQVPEE
ncbi:MAG: alpha/beta fold hydrolase [Bryobacterales bacterium]|nr:alpha/beta fold hydrolase [Bryobacterales bacterium]